ncbi:YifB family Mg chelatase-like AAA ATPase [uncultured Peptoniphilus sp.]|uniref:YifB family Mg chelatase-like AAA ATPase n=1 Tax=uncultured Peptoniphilus sp. TaxID=254354 RepID=UPI0028050A2E|nr:YifB family Mg chelatase-like AAA ATPase [uncultured Peptoniphilus sp.]
MYSNIKTCSLFGLNGYVVDVETDMVRGMPKITLVGLPDLAIKESLERVKSAINNSGYEFPKKRITINLAPANLKKDGSQIDLAIAVGILTAGGSIEKSPDDYVILGELALDGKIYPVQGVLPMVISMREKGFSKFILPYDNRKEAALVSDVEIYPVKKLEEVVEFLLGNISLPRALGDFFESDVKYDMDFSDLKGQDNLKRILTIAAASKGNCLFIGSPGSGKTMAAKRFPTILPQLDFEEAIEVTKIYSVAGLLKENSLVTTPPFRSPHHTASAVALIGGGSYPRPGEISLAHKGVLFLDELPEFSKNVLEVLRQPMEAKVINIARANGTVTYPSDFQLIVAMNPCPCGYYGSKKHECTCSPYQIQRYLSKISHPLLDRIDLHLEVSEVDYKEISSNTLSKSSSEMRKEVEYARDVQKERFVDKPFNFNAEIPDKELSKYCKLDEASKKILELSYKKYRMSARTYNKLLKISRTIADLGHSSKIKEDHILEAIQYRTVDSKFWGN